MDLQEVKDKPGKGSGKKDACYHKVKARYDVWPSAYASGALVKCRQKGASNWGTKSENMEWNDIPMQINGKRYCPKCQKNESREECKYGPRYWDTFSLPIMLDNVGKKYTPNTPHPGNMPESKDHEYSMARSELQTIIDAARRIQKKVKGEGNIEAWVQSKITKAADYLDSAADYIDSGEMRVEDVTLQDAEGNDFVQIVDLIKPEKIKGTVKEKCWDDYEQKGMKKKGKKIVPNCVRKEEYSNWREDLISEQEIEEDLELIEQSNDVIEVVEEYSNWREEISEDWQKVNRKDKTDGLSQAAVNAYRRENPGSKLQTAVTEKNPSGKRAQRRKNFCSRMSGMKSKLTSAETARDPDSRINKALRRWNCN